MSFKKETLERLLPNPTNEGGGWYWLKTPGHQWTPTFVSAATDTWPVCIRDSHSTPVTELPMDWKWGYEIKTPDEIKEVFYKLIET